MICQYDKRISSILHVNRIINHDVLKNSQIGMILENPLMQVVQISNGHPAYQSALLNIPLAFPCFFHYNLSINNKGGGDNDLQ
jgi:hypothetical protein